jgi:hypothetical protein
MRSLSALAIPHSDQESNSHGSAVDLGNGDL